MESYIEAHPDTKTPLVIVDYLQIIPHGTLNSDRLVVNDALDTLRTLAAGKASVLPVSSLNRLSYKDPVRIDHYARFNHSSDDCDALEARLSGRWGWWPTEEGIACGASAVLTMGSPTQRARFACVYPKDDHSMRARTIFREDWR